MKRIPHCNRRLSLWDRVVMGALFSWQLRLWTHVLGAVVLVSTVQAQSPKQLWVLQEPDEIAEYDVATFAVRRTLKVPRRLIEHPEYLSINAKGQMVFLPPKGAQWGSGEMASAADRMWFWDGRQGKERKLEGTKTRGGSAGKPTVTEPALQWFLSAGGEALFWFENRFEKVTDESDVERSVRLTRRFGAPILPANSRRRSRALPPPDGVSVQRESALRPARSGTSGRRTVWWTTFSWSHALLPGQQESTYHESLLYQRSGQKWQAKKLPRPFRSPSPPRRRERYWLWRYPMEDVAAGRTRATTRCCSCGAAKCLCFTTSPIATPTTTMM